MPKIPRIDSPDSSLALLREGYSFLPKRFRQRRSDIFRTRLMTRRVTCVTGPEAAEMFYTPDRFRRQGAMPPTTSRLLQDAGSVQMLEGPDHRHRKALFIRFMSGDSIEQLIHISGRIWEEKIAEWEGRDRVVLLEEMEHLLCRAACEWTGLSLSDRSLSRRTEEFSAMLSGAGSIGPEVLRDLLLRERCEIWARRIVRDVRIGRRTAPENAIVSLIAHHRDLSGALLPVKIAAVELINVLRPTVAVARYIVFIAHALETYPDSRRRLLAGTDTYREWFVQEVRRLYPFFPLVAGIAIESFTWHDHAFNEGDWVILDIYGTNRNAGVWQPEPDAFDPVRFQEGNWNPFSLIPQGAGDHASTHRCPGERVSVALMKQATTFLARNISYRVPPQDLSISLRSMPTQPASGFIITNVGRVV